MLLAGGNLKKGKNEKEFKCSPLKSKVFWRGALKVFLFLERYSERESEEREILGKNAFAFGRGEEIEREIYGANK